MTLNASLLGSTVAYARLFATDIGGDLVRIRRSPSNTPRRFGYGIGGITLSQIQDNVLSAIHGGETT